MTLLLASVTGVEEAQIALAHGADIIDLKDVSRGAFAALPADVVRAVVAAVAGRRPVSAVIGEVAMEPVALAAAVDAMAACGVDYVKVGLFPGPGRDESVRALARAARRTKLVGVLFADAGFDAALVPVMAASGFAGVMIDTAHKGSGRLLDHLDVAALDGFVRQCRAAHLMTGLAGALEPPDIPRLLLLAPDFLGLRGALCAGHDRAGRLDPAAMRMVRELIPGAASDPRRREGEPASHRVLAMRGYPAEPQPPGAADRIFVQDFVMPVRIGAYAKERAKPQKVRFDVEVAVARTAQAAADMRDVLSYDLIMDGIRMIVAQEHIPLVETLAERIADLLLAHPRVLAATVRIEKLEMGAGAVGVEIRRERAPEMAKVHLLYPSAGKTRAGE